MYAFNCSQCNVAAAAAQHSFPPHIATHRQIRACGQVLSFEKLPLSYQFMRQAHRRLHETTTTTVVPISMCVFLPLHFFLLLSFPSIQHFPSLTIFQHLSCQGAECIDRTYTAIYYEFPTTSTNGSAHKWRKWCNSKIT